MTVVAEQNASFEASTLPGLFATGLVGTIGVRLDDGAGGNVLPRTTIGIFESPATATIYGIPEGVLTAPGALGSYLIIWDDGSGTWASEDLIVVAAGSTVVPIPPPAPPAAPEASSGPCSAWVDSDYVLEVVCTDNAESTDPAIFDPWVTIASDLLFRMSGRQFPGSCSLTVRPCGVGGICAGWAWPLTVREFGWLTFANYGGTWGWFWPDGRQGCGCQHVDRVHLPDYPVLAVSEVTIDGDVINPDTYELREFRFLDRLDELVWPSCQDMRLPLGEEGTWGITYSWGNPLPASGVHAAAVLACELYTGSLGGECRLPKGVTQLTRQGVTQSARLFAAWGMQNGQWATGLTEVDAFLQAVNPNGLTGPTTVWSPDLEPFPRPSYG